MKKSYIFCTKLYLHIYKIKQIKHKSVQSCIFSLSHQKKNVILFLLLIMYAHNKSKTMPL